MLKFHAHDTINGVAIIQTPFDIVVRYGLQTTSHIDLGDALEQFSACQRHALETSGQVMDAEE